MGYDSEKETMFPSDQPVITGTAIPEDGNNSKGTKQENSYRDPFFAILYYIHLFGIVIVAFVLGIPSLTANAYAKGDLSQGSVEVSGIITTAVTAAFFSFFCAALALALMMKFARSVIQCSLIFSVVMSGIVAVAAFATGNVVGGIIGLIFFALSACYAWCVWSRIPFAAANLNVGLSAVKSNCGLTLVAYLMTMMAVVYSIIWSLALTGAYTQNTTCDAQGTCTGELNGFATFMLLLSFYWAQQVISNTIHVSVAGTVGTWWYAPAEASSCCSQAIRESFMRANTYSFGSICFGSLLVAFIQALRAMVNNARNNSESNPILLCIAECILSCIQSIVEYFNKWAFIYVGLYGYSYIEAGKGVMALFEAKGFSTVITDDLVGNALSLASVVVGLLAGLVGMIPAAANPDMFAGIPEGAVTIVGFFIGFLVGMVVSSIMMSVVASSVNTVIVCFAEGPAEFQENHPSLSQEMREAWYQAYPELNTI